MRGVLAIISRNITNFRRDTLSLVFSLIMSLFFMFIFSFVMRGAGAGIDRPMSYLIAGIIIMTVFQQSLNNSTHILTDLTSGFMKEIIVSPLPRWQISIGQILSSAAIAFVQGLVILIVGVCLGLELTPLSFLAMAGIMIVAGVIFGSFGLFIATLTRNSSSFQILTNVIVLPFTMLSGAYIPLTVMPKFLAPIVLINPLTYLTAMFRYVALGLWSAPTDVLIRNGIAFVFEGMTITPVTGFFFLLAFGLLFFFLCVRQFNTADFSTVKVAVRRGRH
jgi:ABC-2 type transport system permease protein